MSAINVLRVATKVLLPDDTRVFLAENGVKYYYKTSFPNRFYVKEDGKELDAPWPSGMLIDSIGLSGSDIYFAGNKRVYHITYCNGELKLTLSRHQEESESNIAQGLCRQRTRCQKIGMCEYEYKHLSDSKWLTLHNYIEKEGWALANPMRIHRGNLVLIRSGTCQNPRLYRFSDTVIGVDARSNAVQSFAQDSSPFIYLCSEQYFYTLNMDTLEAPPVLEFENCYSDIVIAGVYNGVITATAKQDGKNYLITTRFPEEYFNKGWPSTTLTTLYAIKAENEEITSRNSALTQELDIMKTLNEKIKTENGALVDSMSEIRQELDRMNTLLDQLKSSKCELECRNSKLTQELDRIKILNDEMNEISKRQSARENEDGVGKARLTAENESMHQELNVLKKQLIQCTIGSLTSVSRPLKFEELEKLTKPFVTIQLENETLMYFDNSKPFELFCLHEGSRVNADLTLWEGEFDCTFRGVVNNNAYFATVRGKIIKFFRASANNDKIELEQIQELKTSQISLFKSEPLYFIERSREWAVYKFDEVHTDVEGEKFNISDIDFLSKYDRHYHRGILYLFRDESTAKVEKVNDKVVIVEGPVLEDTSFYAPPHF